jgi:hypothetical protein
LFRASLVLEEIMRGLIRIAGISGILLLGVLGAVARAAPSPGDDRIVVVFKDGHHQSFAVAEITSINLKPPAAIVYNDGHQEKLASADIARIEFGSAEVAMTPGRAHFVGKWEVGEGNGGGRFFITLDSDGTARKTLGSPRGTWTLVDGEARISWEDGWRDAIRKVGNRHEKRAFEPGKSFDDEPSNVTVARNTQPKPI